MIRRNPQTGEFTLEEQQDGVETEPARPPKFSYPDKYGEYRRKTKKQNTQNNNR